MGPLHTFFSGDGQWRRLSRASALWSGSARRTRPSNVPRPRVARLRSETMSMKRVIPDSLTCYNRPLPAGEILLLRAYCLKISKSTYRPRPADGRLTKVVLSMRSISSSWHSRKNCAVWRSIRVLKVSLPTYSSESRNSIIIEPAAVSKGNT